MINPVEFNDHIIRIAIQEDFNQQGDITSRATCKQNQYGQARIIAKAEGIIAGLSVAQKVFYTINKNIRFDAQKTDGDEVKSGDVIVLLDGPVSDMLSAERVALNFLGRLSGIATMTSHFVAAVQGLDVKILDTRKTTPGLRGLEKYAVRVGGGKNHRFGLFDMFLIKENHILAAGGIKNAVQHCRSFMIYRQITAAIEVETQSLDDVQEALSVKVDRIMLDNMSISLIKEAVELVKGEIELEASGNVSLVNIREIAETGVDFISVGSLTHSVNALDFSMLVD